MMIKNTVPAYENPKERDVLLKKQYHMLQKRFYDERAVEKRTKQRSRRGE